jgi:hypothetical protein
VENALSMLNIIIAYDNLDSSLGSYFTACKDDMVGYLHEQIANGFPLQIVEVIDSHNCHSAYIDLRLNEYQERPLLFIAYSHGLSHSLRCSGNAYIHHTENVHLLFNSILYTNACSTSKELGVKFNNQNGVSIGFDAEVIAFKQEGEMQISIYCDNCGLKYGISNQHSTFEEIYNAMKSYYTQKIDEWDEFGNFLSMSYLRETRDALTIHGNKEITMDQFINQF